MAAAVAVAVAAAVAAAVVGRPAPEQLAARVSLQNMAALLVLGPCWLAGVAVLTVDCGSWRRARSNRAGLCVARNSTAESKTLLVKSK